MSATPLRRARLGALAERPPTAPLAAAGLIAGYGVAVGSGSRPLGGTVMAAFGISCIAIWLARDGRRVAVQLTVAGLFAFAVSHVLGLAIGAWPSVFVVAAATAAACWRLSDSRRAGRHVGFSSKSSPTAGGPH